MEIGAEAKEIAKLFENYPLPCAEYWYTGINMRAVGIVFHEGKILLIHRIKNGSDYFVFPGGGVEGGESLEQALRREIAEELSLQFQACERMFELDNRGNQEVYYLIKEFTGVPEVAGPEKARMTEENQYLLEWKGIEEIKALGSLFPETAKNKVIELFG